MKNQKFFVQLICVILAVLMVLSVVLMVIPARAISQSDIEALQEKRQRLETELQEQAEVIRSLDDNHALVVDRKAALDRQIELNRESIELLEEQISLYDQLISDKAEEVNAAQAAEEQQAALFRSRMRTMEENGNASYFSFIFESENIADLLSRAADVQDIMHYDQQLEEDYRQAREDLSARKDEYEQIQADQSVVRRELDDRKEQLDAQVDAACQLIARLDDLSADAENEYAAIEAAEALAWQEEQIALARLAEQQEAARQAAMAAAYAQSNANMAAALAAAQANGTFNSSGTGYYSFNGFIWPVDSNAVTSYFGYRDAPTAGASTYHQAIDISAAAGAPIYAVADGVVAMATYNNGLGNYVSIAHNGDTSTRYSHMTNFIVQPGEYVTQGQIIGYVGATGIATGNHLDFAVIQGGQAVDPLQFYDTGSNG